jgi:threonine dehydrogenase-like Zn-dependent dehydrogenase
VDQILHRGTGFKYTDPNGEPRVRQAILYGAGDLRIEERPLDAERLKLDEIYVETEVTALSTGTDLGNYLGNSTEIPGAPDYPRPVGYSNVGIVRATGAQVDQARVGQRVFSMKPHQSAFIAQSSELMVPVPDGVSPEQASLAYLAQLGMAALRQAHYESGESVAVVGLGVIGLATLAVARAMGANVTAVANSDLRAGIARKLGVHSIYIAGDAGAPTGIDVVILTANPWSAFRASVDMLRVGGRLSILGFPGRGEPAPDFNPLDPKWFYGKQLMLIGAGLSPRAECRASEIRFNLRRNLEYLFFLMASGAVNLEPVISHRLPAASMRDAYEMAKQHSKSLAAAIFDWRSG